MFEQIVKQYANEFHRSGEEVLRAICNTDVPTKICLSYYNRHLEPIETMTEEEKKVLKITTIEMFPEKTVEQKVVAAKIIYTIAMISQ